MGLIRGSSNSKESLMNIMGHIRDAKNMDITKETLDSNQTNIASFEEAWRPLDGLKNGEKKLEDGKKTQKNAVEIQVIEKLQNDWDTLINKAFAIKEKCPSSKCKGRQHKDEMEKIFFNWGISMAI